jgi:endonuclease/exonuclease/phosphatase family metal-dependent hydrolase
MSRDPALVTEAHSLARALDRHRTLDALHDSPEWPELSARLARLLSALRRYQPATPPAPARPGAPLKVVQWNIEHGNWYDQVEGALLHHPDLAGADLLMFNEIDLGMARAGNRDVAGDLAQALGLYGVWAPLFLETTPGRDDDPRMANGAANQESLFGLAILSRWPFGEVRVLPLPSPLELQFDLERMYGRHVGLVAEVLRPGAPFIAVSAHLEVHRTRAHRESQVREIIEALRGEQRPIVFAGDWNTHTFDRGLWHTPFTGGASLLTWPTETLAARLLRPDRGRLREPLFDRLREHGFEWERWVDYEPTLQLRLERLDEVHALPRWLRSAAARPLAWAERRGRLRLDWFAGRGWRGGRGRTVPGLDGPDRASDHAPIVAEFE